MRKQLTLSRLLKRHFLRADETLRLQLEQALVRQKTDVVLALWTRATKTRSLASGHQNHTNFSIGNRIQANSTILRYLLL
jgi:hypothetical protein